MKAVLLVSQTSLRVCRGAPVLRIEDPALVSGTGDRHGGIFGAIAALHGTALSRSSRAGLPPARSRHRIGAGIGYQHQGR